MPTLSRIESVASGDGFVIYVASESGFYYASLASVVEAIMGSVEYQSKPVSQYAAPSASDFTVQITDDSDDVHLILTPAAGYAAGTIKLPSVANCVDKQTVMVNCTQAITTLTVDGNGAVAVTGAPTTLAANAYFTLKYDAATQTWYRVA